MGKGSGASARPSLCLASTGSGNRPISIDDRVLHLQHPIDISSHPIPIIADIDYDCENSYCNEEGICRCGTIRQLSAYSRIMASDVVELMYASNPLPEYRPDEPLSVQHARMDAYIYHRLIARMQLNAEHFDWLVGESYYGETLDSITLKHDTYGRINDKLAEYHAVTASASAADLNDKVKFALMEEYGHVLPQLLSARFSIQPISWHDIRLPAKKHAANLDLEQIRGYRRAMRHYTKTHPAQRTMMNAVPSMVVANRHDHYRLIDGYHRHGAIGSIVQEDSNPLTEYWQEPLVIVADGQ